MGKYTGIHSSPLAGYVGYTPSLMMPNIMKVAMHAIKLTHFTNHKKQFKNICNAYVALYVWGMWKNLWGCKTDHTSVSHKDVPKPFEDFYGHFLA